MRAFIRRPQTVWIRRLLFQVHLWLGLLTGLYILIVCVTGAALVFRLDMQRALFPALFTPGHEGPAADLLDVLHSVQRSYPDYSVSGVDAPSVARPTALAYVARGSEFRTILVDPVDARVLGELPEHSFVRTLQDLHFDLLAGRTGRRVNGIGGLCLLLMCATGLVIWWPGSATWRRALTIDLGRGWKRLNYDLHSAAGFWTVAFVAMWAITGVNFAFSRQVRSVVNWISPITVVRPPSSDVTVRDRQPPPAWATLVATARRQMPGKYAARIVVPGADAAPFHVLFAEVAPTPLGPGALQSVYLDRYTGAILHAPPPVSSAGDAIMAWMAPLHVGSFAGWWLKPLWFMAGLVPPVLFVTGFIMWWNRVLRRRWPRMHTDAAASATIPSS